MAIAAFNADEIDLALGTLPGQRFGMNPAAQALQTG
jgi:hypothetical protein